MFLRVNFQSNVVVNWLIYLHGRTFLYNPLMPFYAISFALSEEKDNKKSLGSSVASDIRDNEITNKTMPRSISNQKEEEEQ